MSIQYGIKIISDNLLLYYDTLNINSYPMSGSKWYNLAPINVPLDIYNLSLQNPLFGFYYPGYSNKVCQANTNGNINAYLGNNQSICAWIYASSLNQSYQFFVGQRAPCLGINRYMGADPKFWYILHVNGKQKEVVTNKICNLYTWYYVVGTYDGSNLKLYVNSNLEGITSAVGNYTNDFSDRLFQIGNWNGNDYYNYPWDGYCPIVQVYTKTLSQDEIINNYNSLKKRYT